MKPNEEFLNQDKSFWAFVRTVSEEVGYTVHGEDKIRVPTLTEVADALTALKLDASSVRERDRPTELGRKLLDYFAHRETRPDLRDLDLNLISLLCVRHEDNVALDSR